MKDAVLMYERTGQIIMSESLKYIIYQTYLKEHPKKRRKDTKTIAPQLPKTQEQIDKEILKKILNRNPKSKVAYKTAVKMKKESAEIFKQKVLAMYKSGDIISAYSIDNLGINMGI